ncbi:MAG: hypothetical protein ACP5F9_09285 [Thiomonas sp.]|jgi:hypothetical protein
MSEELPLDWVLEKTPKGREELATRSHHLLPGQRNLLILADGHRSVRELLMAGTDPQRCMQALQWLIDSGFLALCASAPAPGAAAAPAPAPGPTSAAPAAHAHLIALVEQQFPAQAARLVQKITQHPDTPEGRAAAVQACVKFIRLFIDERQADAFATRAQEQLH